jgi:hypothetical protein
MRTRARSVMHAAAGAAAGCAVTLAGVSGAAVTPGAAAGKAPRCADAGLSEGVQALRVEAGHRVTLAGLSRRHGTVPAMIIEFGVLCGPGYQQERLVQYVDRGRWQRAVPAGTVIWLPRHGRAG